MRLSYYGKIRAANGCLLLGGVKAHDSSRFANLEDAQSWLNVILRANRDAGRKVVAASVFSSRRPADIK